MGEIRLLCTSKHSIIMKVINFAETNSVLNQYVAEIRDVAVQGDRMRFRRNI